MKTRSQLFIDKKVARPLGYVLNFLVRLLGQVLRIDHNLNREFEVIAVCKFKGMGSILQATPMLYAIRKRHPRAEIIFVSTKANKAILERIDLIDTLVLLDDSSIPGLLSSCFSALWKLIRKRPGVYVDLEIYSDFSTLFTAFTLSKNRLGFYLRSSSFRMGIYTHMMRFNTRAPIARAYLQLAALMGCETENAPLYPLGEKRIKQAVSRRKYMVINPNASDLRLERRWAADAFVALLHGLLECYPDYDFLLVGSPAERDYTEAISQALKEDRVQNMAGKTSLNEVIQLIQDATLMISNDTGPMHIAFCTQTPVICLFGPCSPEQYGMSQYAHFIYKNVYCSPCVHEFETPPCKGNNLCMQLIQPQEVLGKVQELLGQKPPEPVDVPLRYQVGQETLGVVRR